MAAALAATVCVGLTGTASAQQTCGGTYVVQRGDTLSGIANRLYDDAGKWTAIFQNNARAIGSRADQIRVGQRLNMACIDGLPVGLEGGTVVATSTQSAAPRVVQSTAPARRQVPARGAPIKIVASDGMQPFADRLHLSSGIISDVVNRSFVNSADAPAHEFHWINDRAAHLDPILAQGMADVSFPWVKPDCGAEDTAAECTEFVYSDPIFETLILLFKSKSSPHQFNAITDLEGKRLCRPLGLQLSALNSASAELLRNNRLTLMQPRTVQECFARLVRGETDFVAMNEFTGRLTLTDMGLRDQVEIIVTRPLSIETLHVVAHVDNPRADSIIAAFNDGLETMRRSGEYAQVMDTHLTSIWSGF
ncbi:LysM peptidoglycan-binding domain-containing protein [Primorskyibacter sp. S187A]|uniref:LysM peptidoglycan-binding domain-containing protein n=1 Tax=Primorskyibacter sp. S187A TaxID=3415130 RepID=UPI003C7A2DE1